MTLLDFWEKRNPNSVLNLARVTNFGVSLSLIGIAIFAATYLLYWLGLEEGSLKRRIRWFDLGLKGHGAE